jgi:hypothetical protein
MADHHGMGAVSWKSQCTAADGTVSKMVDYHPFDSGHMLRNVPGRTAATILAGRIGVGIG